MVIDVQQALVDYLPESRRTEFIALLAALLRDARAAHVPVVYVRHQDEELVANTPGWAIAAAIGPQAGESIVDKRERDAFRDTNLAQLLEGLHVDHLIVCGMQTEYCVDSTVREAERRGYAVTLVADGHATFDSAELSERQIRDHVNAVAHGIARAIVPAHEALAHAKEAEAART